MGAMSTLSSLIWRELETAGGLTGSGVALREFIFTSMSLSVTLVGHMLLRGDIPPSLELPSPVALLPITPHVVTATISRSFPERVRDDKNDGRNDAGHQQNTKAMSMEDPSAGKGLRLGWVVGGWTCWSDATF